MGAHASGVTFRLGLGGLIFIASDFMIALNVAGLGFDYIDPLVGVTYLIAQYMIVSEWVNIKVTEDIK